VEKEKSDIPNMPRSGCGRPLRERVACPGPRAPRLQLAAPGRSASLDSGTGNRKRSRGFL